MHRRLTNLAECSMIEIDTTAIFVRLQQRRVSMQFTGQTKLLGFGQRTSPGQFRLQSKCGNDEYFLFLMQRKGIFNVNGKAYSLSSFSFLLLAAEEANLTVQHSAPLQWLQFQISPQLLREIGLKVGKPHTIAQPVAVKEIWSILTSCEISNENLCSMTHSCAIGLLLCLLRKETAVDAEKAVSVPHYDKLDALRRDIYLNPSASWNIQDICEQLCISRPYFHKIYLAAFGTTCTQDVIESRIAHAKTLLAATDDAVSVVSQKCGFETDVYFMRQFKRHTGMTPTAYRRICRQEHPLSK